MTEAILERAILALIGGWLVKRNPDTDVDATSLREFTDDDEEFGAVFTVGNEGFRVTIERE